MREAYYVCLRGAAGRRSTRCAPGVTGFDADAAARDMIEAAGFGALFGHGLGHGVGMDVHEAAAPLHGVDRDAEPRATSSSVEPGIYLPGLGGIRIEDLVVVRDSGPEILTSFTKELVTLS